MRLSYTFLVITATLLAGSSATPAAAATDSEVLSSEDSLLFRSIADGKAGDVERRLFRNKDVEDDEDAAELHQDGEERGKFLLSLEKGITRLQDKRLAKKLEPYLFEDMIRSGETPLKMSHTLGYATNPAKPFDRSFIKFRDYYYKKFPNKLTDDVKNLLYRKKVA
ncbi:hypothetical protein PHYBOEH_004594 [Phytophthora boehmeriae]|uniref:RxLR effector protein n=1 Tax=Phytophthora boehmeriae TaxID=109152 RepID=A0A8T1WR91_9STRA|nr:hypothetical protein PHYBOEH_004594 [Phytophthora boehmeriae]